MIALILAAFPACQAVYLFGTAGTSDERSDSDIDVALLLPPGLAKQTVSLVLGPLHQQLNNMFRNQVDLINLRLVSTVLQKEIVFAERRIYCADQYHVEEFEMLVLSYYQQLNYERRAILESFKEDGRAYKV